MEKIAQQYRSTDRYSDGLQSVVNPHVYTGPISGVANDDTRMQLMNWIDHSFRCPVVVESWLMSRGRRSALFGGPAGEYEASSQNLWRHAEVPRNAPRMFVRDFTDYYSLPLSRRADEVQALGDYITYRKYSGPRSIAPMHTWPEAEMLPGSFVGAELESLSPRATVDVQGHPRCR